MKWITHETVTMGAALVLGFSPAALGGAFVGSVLPDVLDQRAAALFRDRNRAFNRIHRGTTHWFGWWILLWLAGALGPELLGTALPGGQGGLFSGMEVPPALWAGLAGLGFGGLVHVALDCCTVGGVPVLPWSRKGRVALRLCRTGGLGEYLFLGLALVVFFVVLREDALGLVQSLPGRLAAALGF